MPWIEGFNRCGRYSYKYFRKWVPDTASQPRPAPGRPNLTIARSYEKPRYWSGMGCRASS